MKKGREVEKKSRGRNLKGLSIFYDEIAAPADYGDFMKIDAPVSLRTAKAKPAVVQEVAPAPHWEKFIGNDGVPANTELRVKPKVPEEVPLIAKSVPEIKTQPTGELSHEVVTPIVSQVSIWDPLQPVEEKLQIEEIQIGALQELKVSVSAEATDVIAKTAHKVLTIEPYKIEGRNTKVVVPKTIQPGIRLRSNGYEKITLSYGFGSLVGVQRRIILFVFEDCVRAGKSETTPLTTEHLCQTLGLTYKTTRGSVWRLQEKRFLEVAASKEGRGGWVIYRLNREIYSELLLLKNNSQLLERDIGIGTMIPETSVASAPHPEPVVVEADKELASEWHAIDFSGLENIGFTKYHLKQLVIQKKNKLTPAEVQDYINFFVFDLKKNNKKAEITGEPLNYFMGIVRNGNPYVPPLNYRSAEDERRLQYLNYLKRKEKERQEEEQKILDLEFTEWRRGLSESELLKLLPEFARKPGLIQDSALKSHFENEVWPERQAIGLGLTTVNREQFSYETSHSLNEKGVSAL